MLRFVFVVFLLCSMAGCNSGERGAGDTQLTADQAWDALTTWPNPPGRSENETELEYFLRIVELSAQRRRERGFEFWSRFPDDPRRYSWLLLAVAIPPTYPTDIETWVRLAADPRMASIADVDNDAIVDWDTRYEGLRSQFLASTNVDAEAKRFLKAAELREAVTRLHQRRQSGQEFNVDAVLDAYEAFFAEYGEPFRELDRDAYSRLISSLWNDVVLDLSGAFAWDTRSFSRYLDRIEATGNRRLSLPLPRPGSPGETLPSLVDTLRLSMDRNGELPLMMRQSTPEHRESLDEIEKLWERLPRRPISLSVSYEGQVAQHHAFQVYARKLRDYGVLLWQNQLVSSEKVLAKWLHDTLYAPPTYAVDFVGGLHHRVRVDPADLVRDGRAIKVWKKNFELLIGQIRSADIDSDLLWLQEAIVFEKVLVTAPYSWRSYRDKSEVYDALSEVERLFTEYSDVEKTVYWANKIVRDPDSLGLSIDELEGFVSRLYERSPSQLSQPKSVLESLIAVRKVPFELKGTTIDNEPFDLTSYRGKIVLLEHWSTSCAACIADMPRLKRISERFARDGFEVVSIVYDWERNRRRVLRIKDELSLDWTTVIGDEQYEEISNKYGFKGFPQYMLLRRDGTLFASTAEIGDIDNLENMLPELLRLGNGQVALWKVTTQ